MLRVVVVVVGDDRALSGAIVAAVIVVVVDVVYVEDDFFGVGLRENVHFGLTKLGQLAHVKALGAFFGAARALKLPHAQIAYVLVGKLSCFESLVRRVDQFKAVDVTVVIVVHRFSSAFKQKYV